VVSQALWRTLVPYLGFVAAVVLAWAFFFPTTPAQHAILVVRLGWILGIGTVVATYAWLWQYQALSGWFFRCRAWDLSKSMATFGAGGMRRVIEALLPPWRDQDAEAQIILGEYYQRFNSRLQPILAEGKERGCISDEAAARLRVPGSVEQIRVNAEDLRTLALRYRRY
jgi:hypothetical protein